MTMTRRKFLKTAGIVTATAGIVGVGGFLTGCGEENNVSANTIPPDTDAYLRAKVYFTKNIDAEHLIELYQKINAEIKGKVAIKIHTGEPHGPNILPRDMVAKLQAQIPNSAIIETNTAYGGARSNTASHRQTLEINGWNFCPVDIIDAEGDVNFPVKGGFHLEEVAMGSHLTNYDSMIVLTHFKGHTMGGFGGSLKNIAIGCASGKKGKLQVHGVQDYGKWVTGDLFMELMADSAKSICDYFGCQIVFINVMRRMSVDCDCMGTSAAEPTMADIGMLASTDILAIDKASVDLVYSAPDSKDLRERIESRSGLRQLSAMKDLFMGNDKYDLISID